MLVPLGAIPQKQPLEGQKHVELHARAQHLCTDSYTNSSQTQNQETAWLDFFFLTIIFYYTLVLQSTTVTAELSQQQHTHQLYTQYTLYREGCC